MSNAQAGIFAQGSSHFFHLEYSLTKSAKLELLKPALASAIAPVANDVEVVIAFGKRCWQLLAPNFKPEELVDFTALDGCSGYSMPATQGDVMLWIQANDESSAVDQLLASQAALNDVLALQLDVQGFRYHDSRDLIGFVDGTANPKAEKRFPAGQIQAPKQGAGGSYVLSQKWVHKLSTFKALPLVEQERTVGRTKEDDVELEGEAQPVNSHVSRTDVSVNSVAQKIWRRSSPFATASEQGLFFLSFSSELSRFDIQLKRMVGATDDGIYDRLMDYSSAVSGAYWFAPSQQDLAAVLAV